MCAPKWVPIYNIASIATYITLKYIYVPILALTNNIAISKAVLHNKHCRVYLLSFSTEVAKMV